MTQQVTNVFKNLPSPSDYLLQLLYLYAHELVHIASTILLFCLAYVILLCLETRI